MAVVLHAALRRNRISLTPRLMWVAGGLIVLAAVGPAILELAAFGWLVAHRGEGARIDLTLIRNFALVLPLVAFAGLLWARASRNLPARIVLGAALVLALVAFWDERTDTARRIEARVAPPGLVEAVAQRPGAVLWLDGEAQAWLLLGRPNWITNLQGASIVFSPDLAEVWADRMNRLVESGLASEGDRAPFHPAGPRRPDDPPPAALATLCAAPDAPAWIVVPLRAGQVLPGQAGIFPLADPLVTSVATPEGVSWRRIVAYGLLACRD